MLHIPSEESSRAVHLEMPIWKCQNISKIKHLKFQKLQCFSALIWKLSFKPTANGAVSTVKLFHLVPPSCPIKSHSNSFSWNIISTPTGYLNSLYIANYLLLWITGSGSKHHIYKCESSHFLVNSEGNCYIYISPWRLAKKFMPVPPGGGNWKLVQTPS